MVPRVPQVAIFNDQRETARLPNPSPAVVPPSNAGICLVCDVTKTVDENELLRSTNKRLADELQKMSEDVRLAKRSKSTPAPTPPAPRMPPVKSSQQPPKQSNVSTAKSSQQVEEGSSEHSGSSEDYSE